MPLEQNRIEKERVLSRLVSNDSTNFGIMLVLLAMIGSQMYFGQILGNYQFPIFIFLFIIFVFSFFRMIQNRKLLKQYFEPNAIGVDPILILSGLGIDIYGYSENLLVTCSDLHKRLDAIGDHITDLNVKIQTTGKDIDRVYQIVSQLASEEVKLMEAVGKTSEEINIMFDIVNVVIAEIQSRNETMENLVNLSQNGRKKVNDTNTTIQRISESSGNILKLIDFINGVSKQTNCYLYKLEKQ